MLVLWFDIIIHYSSLSKVHQVPSTFHPSTHLILTTICQAGPLLLFSRGGNPGSERFSNLSQVTQLVSGRARILTGSFVFKGHCLLERVILGATFQAVWSLTCRWKGGEGGAGDGIDHLIISRSPYIWPLDRLLIRCICVNYPPPWDNYYVRRGGHRDWQGGRRRRRHGNCCFHRNHVGWKPGQDLGRNVPYTFSSNVILGPSRKGNRNDHKHRHPQAL